MPNSNSGSRFAEFDRDLRSWLDQESVGPRRPAAPSGPDPFLSDLTQALDLEEAAGGAPAPRIGVPDLPTRTIPAPPEPTLDVSGVFQGALETGGMVAPRRTTDLALSPPPAPVIASGGVNARADLDAGTFRRTVPTFREGAGLAERFGERILGPLVAKAAPRVADVGISGVKGAIGLVESGVGAMDLAMPAGEANASDVLGHIGFQPAQAKAILDRYYSDPQRRAFQTVDQANGAVAKTAAALKNWSVLVHSAVESAPSIIGAAAIARASGLPPISAGGLGEGVLSAGSTYAGIEQDKGTATEADRLTAMTSGAVTGLLGRFSGKLAASLGVTDLDTLLAGAAINPTAGRNLARRVLIGAVEEGFLEELPQSVQEQVAQNYATGRPIWENVDDAAVLGALTGAVLGGGTQFVTPSEASRPQSRGPAKLVAPWATEMREAPASSPGVPEAPQREPVAPQDRSTRPAPVQDTPVPPPVVAPPVVEAPATGQVSEPLTPQEVAAIDLEQPEPQPATDERERNIDALMAALEQEAANAPEAESAPRQESAATPTDEDVVTPEPVEPEAKSEALAPRDQLFVVRGRDRLPVDSVEDAATKWEEFRDAVEDEGPGAGGVSTLGNGLRVERADGTEVARISYNGRIWNPDGTVYRDDRAKSDVPRGTAEDNPADVARRMSKEDFAAQARRWKFTPDAARLFWDIAHKPAQNTSQESDPRPATTPPQAATGDGATVTWNEDRKSVEVKFPKKPLASTLDTLKKAGFRWAKDQGVWFHKTPGDLLGTRPDKSRNIRHLAVEKARTLVGLPESEDVAPEAVTAQAEAPSVAPEPLATTSEAQQWADAQAQRLRDQAGQRTTPPQQAIRSDLNVMSMGAAANLYAVGDRVRYQTNPGIVGTVVGHERDRLVVRIDGEDVRRHIDARTLETVTDASEAVTPPKKTRSPQQATKKVPAQAEPKKTYRKIGIDPTGKFDIEVDENGIRSFNEGGIRRTETVAMVPTREGVKTQRANPDIDREFWTWDEAMRGYAGPARTETPEEEPTHEQRADAVKRFSESAKAHLKAAGERRAELAAKRAALKDQIAEKVGEIRKEAGKAATQLNAGLPVPPRALVAKVYDLVTLYGQAGIVEIEDGWLAFEEDFGEGFEQLRRAFELAWSMFRPQVAGGLGTAQTGTEEPGDATDTAEGRRDVGGGQPADVRGSRAATGRTPGGATLAPVPAETGQESRGGESDRPAAGDSERVAPDAVPAGPAPGGRHAGGARTDGVSGTALSPTGDQQDPGPQPTDYVLTPERIRAIIDRGDMPRLRDNIAAIKIIKDLQQTQRHATPEEQETLAKYVGWGASEMAQYLNEYPGYNWSAPQREAWTELHELTTPEERQALVRSTPNAHFTFDLYRPIWAALERFGFAGGRILEPAIGAGHAFGMMPASIRANARLQGVELDPITATIAQALYPSAKVQAVGYEKSRIAKNTQDLVISNVPFGAFGVVDKSKPASITHRIHNYFFDKALDHVREGGYVVFVSSRYTLDATTESAFRRHLMTRAHFVGAVRLPNTAFDKTAKTEVVTDIVVLQKRMADETGPSRNADLFIESNEVPSLESTRWGRRGKQEIKKVYRSAWYEAHPDLVLGTETTSGTMYGGGEYTVEARAADLEDDLRSALLDILPANSYTATPAAASIEGPAIVSDAFKAGEFRLDEKGHVLTVNQDGEVSRYTTSPKGKALSVKELARIAGMIRVRDALRTVMTTMTNPEASDADIAKTQKALKKAYDAFEKAHGRLTDAVNRRLFAEDPEAANLRGLEHLKVTTQVTTNKDGKKVRKVTYMVTGLADIFTKRTIQAQRAIERVDTPEDALLASLGVKTVIDWPYMARISGRDAADLQQALVDSGRLFVAPDGTWVTSDQYLSGDVVTKLADAEAAVAAGDTSFTRNVKALEAVQPARKTADKIRATLGSHWIPVQHVETFAEDQNKRPVSLSRVSTSSIVSWEVRAADGPRHDLAVVYRHGTKTYGLAEMLEDALNLRQPDLGWWEGSGDDRHYVKDVEATTAAKANLDELRARWLEWVVAHPEVEEELVDIYNARFNRTVPWVPDGSHLANFRDGVRTPALPGLALPFRLYPHQLRAVWRILTSGNTLLAHEVGAGKTFEMIIAAMEMRRTGRATKPMITVPTYLLGQWRDDILRAYPQAKLLAFEEQDLASTKRQAAMAKIATGDWDIVLVPHSSFTLLKNSDARMAEVLQGFVNELTDAIKDERARSGEKAKSVKQLETQRRKLEDKLHDRMEAAQKGNDNNLTWDQLGVDALFVDEAHAFKNLWFHTNMDNLKGLSRSEADRSLDLYVKIGSINAQSNHRNVVLATATPIMNSLVELYTMQRYLQPNTLREQGVEAFDAWYTMFAEAANVVEPSPDGSFAETRRLKHFRNLKTLYQMASGVMDYVGWKDMPYLNLPTIKGGKVEILEAPPHPMMQRLTEWFTERLAILKKNPPKYDHRNKTYVAPIRVHPVTGQSMNRFDNILTVMNDATLAAIDPRMVLPGYATDFAGSRVQVVADETAKTYREEADTKGTILIFLDHGTPQAPGPLAFMMGEGLEDTTGGEALGVEDEADDTPDDLGLDDGSAWNMYDALRDALVKRKIPARQIAYVHQAQTPAERVALFDAVNKGEVRVLIASTDKGGVGMNVQARMARLIEMGPPRYRRPGDIRQRWGRGIRQGNMYPEIQITRIVTKSPMDAWTYGLIATKQAQIEAFMRGDAEDITEQDAMTLSIDEAMALASDNPLVVELNDLKPQLTRLRAQATAAERAQASARGELKSARDRRREWEERLEDYKTKLLVTIPGSTGPIPVSEVSFSGDDFSVTVGQTTYDKQGHANEAIVARLRELTEEPQRRLGETESVSLGFVRTPDVRLTASHKTFLKNVDGRTSLAEDVSLTVWVGDTGQSAGVVYITPGDPARFTGRNFVASILNAIDRVKGSETHAKEEIARYSAMEADAEAALKKSFPAKEKLATIEQRVAEIETQLAVEGKAREAEAAAKLATSETAQKAVQHQQGTRSPQQATADAKDVSDANITSGPRPARPTPTPADIPRRTTPPTQARPIETPELVELARILIGRPPELVKALRKAEKTGEFRGWGGIRLSLELFKPGNEQELAEVLRHEMGHLIDWLPDQTMRRGNLLGRLNTLRDYMRHTYVTPSSGIVEKLKEIKPELIALSKVWRPWDRTTAERREIEYRDSARELYADAVSALLSDPGFVKGMAPKFYDAFFEGLRQKPEVETAYLDLLELVGKGQTDVVEARRARVQAWAAEGDVEAKRQRVKKEAAKAARSAGLWNRIRVQLFTKHTPFIDRVEQLRKRGIPIAEEKNPVFALDERNYMAGKLKAWVQRHAQPMKDTLDDLKIPWSAVHELMFYDRILEGDASEAANPGAFTPAHVRDMRERLRASLSLTQWKTLTEEVDRFRAAVKDVARQAFEAGLYNEQTWNDIQGNTAYGTFRVIEHMDTEVSSRIIRRQGTLKPIQHVGDATILKTLKTLQAIEHNRVKTIAISFLRSFFPEDVPDAKTIFDKERKIHRPIDPPSKDQVLVTFYEGGQWKGVYVEPYIADSLDNLSYGHDNFVVRGLRLINGKWFRQVFTGINLGFQSNNLLKDSLRYWKNNPGYNPANTMRRYYQAVPLAKIRAFGMPEKPSQADLDAFEMLLEAEEGGMLSLTFNDILDGREPEDTQIEQILRDVGAIQTATPSSWVSVRALSRIFEWIRQAGDLIETLPKAAAMYDTVAQMRKAQATQGGTPTRPPSVRDIGAARREFIRRKIGSPDFLSRGTYTPVSNEVFLFSNAIIQGWRADVEVATSPQTWAGWLIKTLIANVLPKALMFAALVGVFRGDGDADDEDDGTLARLMRRISEYDLTNYTVVPLGEQGKKTVYLRLPQDDTGRVIGGLVWKALQAGWGERDQNVVDLVRDVVDYSAGQFPSVSPILSVGSSTLQYLTGRNVYDPFRGRFLFTDDELEARSPSGLPHPSTVKKFIGYEFQEIGGGIVWKFVPGESRPVQKTGLQVALDLPILSNVVGRWIKVSDLGETEALRAAAAPVGAKQAYERLEKRKLVRSELKGLMALAPHQRTDGRYWSTARTIVEQVYADAPKKERDAKTALVVKELRMGVTRGEADPLTEQMVGPSSVAEKVAILRAAQRRMPADEWARWMTQARNGGIVTEGVFSAFATTRRPQEATR